MTQCNSIQELGSKPATIKWNVVRGDTAELRVEFLENDEVTFIDISDWEFSSSAYDSRGEILDDLEVVVSDGYVDIIASSDVTRNWGEGSSSIVAELVFDLEVTINGEKVWTPLLGTISVLGDVTGGSL
jgi:hypothetical protein